MYVNWNLFGKGSMQNKFSVKVGNLGGGSDPIPTFIKHCFYGIFDPFLPKISEKFTEKIPTFGRGGEGGSSRLGQIPNFYRKFVLEAPLNVFMKLLVIMGWDGWKEMGIQYCPWAILQYCPRAILVFHLH